jgi:hypothetical protein
VCTVRVLCRLNADGQTHLTHSFEKARPNTRRACFAHHAVPHRFNPLPVLAEAQSMLVRNSRHGSMDGNRIGPRPSDFHHDALGCVNRMRQLPRA